MEKMKCRCLFFCLAFALVVISSGFVLSAPVVEVVSPLDKSILDDDKVILEVNTDVDSVCNYSLSHYISFPNQGGGGSGGGGSHVPLEMKETGGKNHLQDITSLTETINNKNQSENYSVKVSCVDIENESTDAISIFYVELDKITLEILKDYAIDTDANGFYNEIVFEAKADSSRDGNFNLKLLIQRNSDEYLENQDNVELIGGDNFVLGGKYHLHFYFDDDGKVFGYVDSKKISENYFENGDVLDYVLPNGALLFLNIHKISFDASDSLSSTVIFSYKFFLEERGEEVYEKFYQKFLVQGEQVISFTIPWQEVYGDRIDGTLTINQFSYGEVIDEMESGGILNYKSSPYHFMEFERPAKILRINADYPVDVNADGLYDYIVLEYELDVSRAGEYFVSTISRTGDGSNFYFFDHEIVKAKTSGVYIAKVYINGWYLNRFNISKNILIGEDSWVCENNYCFSSDPLEYTTREYDYKKFSIYPLKSNGGNNGNNTGGNNGGSNNTGRSGGRGHSSRSDTGSSSDSPPPYINPDDSADDDSNDLILIGQKDNVEDGFSLITGAVVGGGKSGWLWWLIILIIILAVVGAFFYASSRGDGTFED